MTSIALALASGACGAAGATSATEATEPEAERAAQSDICPGWVRHDTPGGTSFALPGPARREQQGTSSSFTHGETEVYFRVIERVFPGFEGGSDAAAIDGVLAGLGDPATAQLHEGWRIIEQRRTVFEGRPAAEHVIDISGQALRRELYLRVGDTMVSIITMVRRNRADQNTHALACFRRALRFAVPPSG